MDQQKAGIDKNTVLAILICAAIWFGWQTYLEKKYPEAMHPQKTADGKMVKALPQQSEPERTQTASGTTTTKDSTKTALQPKGQETTKTYEDANWRVTFSSFGGRIAEVVLKKYLDRDGKPIVLVNKGSPGYLTTTLEGGPDISQLNYSLEQSSPTVFQMTGSEGGVQIKKTLTVLPEKYAVDVETNVSGQTGNIKHLDFQVTAPAPEPVEAQGIGSIFGQIFSSGNTEEKKPAKGPEMQEYFFSYRSKTDRLVATPKDRVDKNYEQTNFAALGSRYFTTLLFNRNDVLPIAVAAPQGDVSLLRLSYPVLNNSAPVGTKFTLYAGPKLLTQLQQIDESAGQVMDLGRFSWIAIPLLKLMKLLYEVFKNWGAAIIGLTILVRLITYPFTYMSYRSMKAMQRIQPEMTRVREKHKDNPTVMNREVMRLWKENKVNPMGGCLPIFLQLPVFWALYTVLQNSIELYHAPFVFWIQDLSLKDPYYILPVLMGATMFIQQKMTPNTMDPAQARMMMIMPIFFAFLMMNLPSGLTLYIFVSTLFGIIQQSFAMRDRSSGPGPGVTVIGSPVRGTSK